jgi:hypothetical protein
MGYFHRFHKLIAGTVKIALATNESVREHLGVRNRGIVNRSSTNLVLLSGLTFRHFEAMTVAEIMPFTVYSIGTIR